MSYDFQGESRPRTPQTGEGRLIKVWSGERLIEEYLYGEYGERYFAATMRKPQRTFRYGPGLLAEQLVLAIMVVHWVRVELLQELQPGLFMVLQWGDLKK